MHPRPTTLAPNFLPSFASTNQTMIVLAPFVCTVECGLHELPPRLKSRYLISIKNKSPLYRGAASSVTLENHDERRDHSLSTCDISTNLPTITWAVPIINFLHRLGMGEAMSLVTVERKFQIPFWWPSRRCL